MEIINQLINLWKRTLKINNNYSILLSIAELNLHNIKPLPKESFKYDIVQNSEKIIEISVKTWNCSPPDDSDVGLRSLKVAKTNTR